MNKSLKKKISLALRTWQSSQRDRKHQNVRIPQSRERPCALRTCGWTIYLKIEDGQEEAKKRCEDEEIMENRAERTDAKAWGWKLKRWGLGTWDGPGWRALACSLWEPPSAVRKQRLNKQMLQGLKVPVWGPYCRMFIQNSFNSPTTTTPEAPSDLFCLWGLFYWGQAGLEIPPHSAALRNHVFGMSFSLVVIAPLRRVARLWGTRLASLTVWLYFGNQFRSFFLGGVFFPFPLSKSIHMWRGKKNLIPIGSFDVAGRQSMQ